jgi:hypothetical protein
MRLSRIRRQLYRGARDLGDVQAAARGPVPLAKRLVRKPVYRVVNRQLGRVLRRAGL